VQPAGADDLTDGTLFRCRVRCLPRAARCRMVRPPTHRCDCQRRSVARTDPAGRGKPAWLWEGVRLATTVGDLQPHVFIEGDALDRFPAVILHRRAHCVFSQQSDGDSISAESDGKLELRDGGLPCWRQGVQSLGVSALAPNRDRAGPGLYELSQGRSSGVGGQPRWVSRKPCSSAAGQSGHECRKRVVAARANACVRPPGRNFFARTKQPLRARRPRGRNRCGRR
jgi:hypothetical protein